MRINPPITSILLLNLLPILYPIKTPIKDKVKVITPIKTAVEVIEIFNKDKPKPAAKASILVAIANTKRVDESKGLNFFRSWSN